MATITSRTLFVALVAFIAFVLATPAAAAASLPCPSQVDSVLASAPYSTCRADLSTTAAWIFTPDHADAIRKSDACGTVLRSLEAIPFDSCVTTIVSSNNASPATRVTIAKDELHQFTASALSTRRLRQAMDNVKRALAEGDDTDTSSMNYNYLYIGIAISIVMMVVCCVLNRGGVLCCCIPIPLCC